MVRRRGWKPSIDDDGNPTDRPSRFREFDKDFFDLIVIEEAHRGGAKEDGTWSELLKYFSSAVQVGLTATPKRDENNNTYDYFGASNPQVKIFKGRKSATDFALDFDRIR